jgi:hypothetical protein
MRRLIALFSLVVALGVSVTPGCVRPVDESRPLSRVAKDWSLVVRASQVLPIYPLSEDVQVGDCFVTQTPIGEEVALFESSGFLPLDNHVKRLGPIDYSAFYPDGVYDVRPGVHPPAQWQFPPASQPATQPTPYASAPRAAFPSYSFTVSREAGVNLTLPVQSVPIGISLLGASTAHGDITIADAYTYGIDEQTLRAAVKAWADTPGARELLRNFGPIMGTETVPGTAGGPPTTRPVTHLRYLRVVSRVYLTGRVNVSLFNDDQFAGAVSVKTPTVVDLLTPSSDPSGYEGVLDAINRGLDRATSQPATQPTTRSSSAPSIGVKVAAISGRAVSLVETFPRPLVVGYLAFDFPIDANGNLGLPVTTKANLRAAGAPVVFGRDSNSDLIQTWLLNTPAPGRENLKKLNDWLHARHYDADVPALLSADKYAAERAEVVADPTLGVGR